MSSATSAPFPSEPYRPALLPPDLTVVEPDAEAQPEQNWEVTLQLVERAKAMIGAYEERFVEIAQQSQLVAERTRENENALKGHIEVLEKGLEEASDRNAHLQAQVGELQVQNAELQAEVADLRTQVSQRDAAYAELREHAARLQAQNETYRLKEEERKRSEQIGLSRINEILGEILPETA